MKFAKLPVLTSIMFAISPRVDNSPYITTSCVYGPFDGSQDEIITLVAHGDYTDCRLFVTYKNEKYGTILGSEKSLISYYSPNSEGEFNYTLRTSGRINGDGLRVIFNLSKEKGTGTIQEILLYPTIPQVIYSYQYRNSSYRTYNTTFKIEGRDLIRNYEEYQFENTIDYIANTPDNYLDIREINFTYDDGNELINKEEDMFLIFKDNDSLFPLLEEDEEGYMKVPVKCIQNGSDINFDFIGPFYYRSVFNYITLTPAISGIRLYKTDRFILPKVGVRKLENYDFSIEMNNFGRNKNKVIIPLTFFKDRNYTGLCSDSSYCIVGGIRE